MSRDGGEDVAGPGSVLEQLRAQVEAARSDKKPLHITGGNTKAFYGEPCTGETLNVTPLAGIVAYEPSELVITALAGTPLSEIDAELGKRGQMLGFEPPVLGDSTTIGGLVASGLSGPARPWRGSCRDFVLGMEIINGKAEVLRFGGQVMKNVAGYDVSRLQCGALGSLGVITEISLRVLPRPPHESTLQWTLGVQDAMDRMTALQRRPWPISALCYHAGRLRVRMSGSSAAIDDAVERLKPEACEASDPFWNALRDMALPAQIPGADECLWRLSVAPTSALALDESDVVIDWGGAQRWLTLADDRGRALRDAVSAAGGHATRVRGNSDLPVFSPLPPAMSALSKRVKTAFDPLNLFNPGRLPGAL